MNKFLSAAAIALALAGCETMSSMTDRSNAGPVTVDNQTVEARAQHCADRGLRPGSRKFALCLDRSAEKAVTVAPAPRPKPAEPQVEQAKDGDWHSSDDGLMSRIDSMFN